MSAIAYRMFFGERQASAIELDRVERIVVEQEMDMAWEAEIRLFLCMDEKGRWQHRADEFAEPFSRVRIEVRRGAGPFKPLIDGPVAGYETELSTEPGRSTVTLKVRDDSALLNREEKTEVFEDRNDEVLARELFQTVPQIKTLRTLPTKGRHEQSVRRGTAMAFLRRLAKANGFHAYVLPGDAPGQSIGCFLPPPKEPGDLPPLVFAGSGRNLADLKVEEDAAGAERSRAYSLKLGDRQAGSAERSAQDLQLLRDFPALEEKDKALREVPAEDADGEDAEKAAEAQARTRSYTLKLSGAVADGCYPAFLEPYRRVSVQAGDLPHSGAWLLSRVVHRLSPSGYRQEFEAKSDSRTDPKGAKPGGAGGLSVDFAQSISVF